ncbi:hypothetical protein TcBrA4_0051290 [Trypanosoma cruzi]|nr:hypothetical protein TcBrA4_0051290 [Trypanosoma cruzi]
MRWTKLLSVGVGAVLTPHGARHVFSRSTRILEIDAQKSRTALRGGRGALVSKARWGRVAVTEESAPRLASVCFHEISLGPLYHGAQAFFGGRVDRVAVAVLCDKGGIVNN